MSTSTTNTKPLPIARLSITGAFMGLANLVPGVSGGTMVLALGLYDEFINAMASVTRLRPTRRSLTVLALLFGTSLVTILLFSSVIQFLMEMFKPGMLALFIGMTLGGAPALWKDLKPLRADAWVSMVGGLLLMAAVALILKPGIVEPNFILLFVGGIIASSAMILPGISGSYMLLIMGLYLPIIAGVSSFKDALRGGDFGAVMSIGLTIGLPVGLGIVVGLVGFSSLLKFLLDRYHRPTLGFLLGLLVGSVIGLYPFQQMSFDKLPRYAQSAEVGPSVLNVTVYGAAESDHPVREQIRRLESERLKVVFIPPFSESPTVESVTAARETGTVLIAYDQTVPREVRKAAADKKAGKVELILVPNAEFSPLKAFLCIVLAVVGLLVTLGLGRLGGEKAA